MSLKSVFSSYYFLVALMVLVATFGRANEDTKTNPYESIAARNPFQLKDPPPAPDPNDVVKPPPPQLASVELTGVVNLLSKKKALLEIVPGPGKPAEKKTLEEGDRVDMVEVLSIDVDEGLVKIRNGDVITNIALKVSKPPAGAVPGTPLQAGQPAFPPPVLQPATSAGIVPPTGIPGAANPNASPYDRGNVMVVGGAPATATPTSPGVIAKPNYGAYGAGGTPAVAPNAGTPTYNSGVNVTGGSDLRPIPSRPIRTEPQLTPLPRPIDPRRPGTPTPPLPPTPGLDPNQ